MIATKDKDGNLRGNRYSLARLSNVPVEAVDEALRKFQSPDPDSNNTANEGRRIEAIPGGWHIVSHADYRARDYREVEAERKKEYRKKSKMSRTCPGHVPDSSVSVSASSSDSKIGGEGERCEPDNPANNEAIKPPDPQFTRCWEAFEKYGVKKTALKYWRKYSRADRDKIEAAIPDYNEAVRAGRPRKQFEGWINQEHRLWDMDWRKAAEVAREKNAPQKLVNTFHQKTKDKSLLAF